MNSTTSSSPISRSGRRMAFAGSLVAGGIAIGALFSPIGLAGAQDDSFSAPSSVDSVTANAATDDAMTGESGAPDGRHGPRRAAVAGASEILQDLLGMSSDELQAARADGQTLVETAAAQGVSESELVTALVDEATARITAAVDDGHLDADRAATMVDELEARISDAVNRVPGDRPADGEGRGERGRGAGGVDRAEFFTELGLDADEMRTALESGSTLSEAAAAQGVSEDELVAAMTAAAEERLAAAVADGRIDADKAAEIEAGIAERIQDRLDGVRPENGRPGMRGHGPGGADDAAVEGEA